MAAKIIMIGATGAVGSEVVQTLVDHADVEKITLLGRRELAGITSKYVTQEVVELMTPESYREMVDGHNTAICTLGIGEPSKVDKETLIRVDKTAVLDFAKTCKEAGVRHFELLASVSTSPKSPSFYLRVKGELIDELKKLEFERLSIFQPSMILTPANRYGFSQWLTLKCWPWLHPFLLGPLRKYRGIKVEQLGRAMAKNLFTEGAGFEGLHWDEFVELTRS